MTLTLSYLLDRLRPEFPLPESQAALDRAVKAVGGKAIAAITSDSKEVTPGSIFIGVPGTKYDGHSYIGEVTAKGPAFIIGERPGGEFGLDDSRYLALPDSRLVLGILASELYRNPSQEMMMIGVTGTSGKTTTSFLIESILKTAGRCVGLIGTVLFRIDGREIPSTHTTPGPLELQKLLRQMRDEGCDSVVMEVSSHALKQHRAAGVAFDGALFTNLSPEHLDYHPDMDDYFRSKAILFGLQAERSRRRGKNPKFAVHIDDPQGRRLVKEIAPSAASFSVPADARIDATGIRGTFSGISIESTLIGRFNAENIAGAVAVTKACGISPDAIQSGIHDLKNIPGRLERVRDEKGGRVILVDYAHKPDALEKVLEVLRPMRLPGKKLVCVFGCGGDRDRAKRPMMGEIACRLADQVILTSDNPRTENPDQILNEIQSGCRGHSNFVRVADRKSAIEDAIHTSGAGDIVLIAGKGHEDYQIIGTTKIHFDDREVARGALDQLT